MAETANIAMVANKVSKDIFEVFKWEAIPIMDKNFKCHKIDQHKPKENKRNIIHQSYTHPVDVVFKYYDPYLGKYILLNTDLKCYSTKSINFGMIENALKSLSHTIDCARSSPEWIERYHLDSNPYEIRGMLFIYNHDGDNDKNIYSMLTRINPEKINLKENQVIHIVEPRRIIYLNTVLADLCSLQAKNLFPKQKYSFFYPDLHLHKTHGDSEQYPATVEMLCSPYLILKHGPFDTLDENTGQKETNFPDGGYLVYYNQDGSTEYEFLYLFDCLSRHQILNTNAAIKIRVAHSKPHHEIMSNYKRAIDLYVKSWHLDIVKKRQIERIECDHVSQKVPNYMPGHLAWRYL